MNSQDLERLLRSDETDRVEKTRAGTDTDKFGEAICAFANDLPGAGERGYLFVGANPDGTASGLSITDQLLQNLAALRTDGNLIPPPSMVVQRVALGGGEMAVVEVQPSVHVPVRYKQRIWVRIGPRRGMANPEDERVLLERRQARSTSWDMQACEGAALDDLALDLFTLQYRPRAVDRRVIDENHRPITQQLSALRLYNDRGTIGPTHAGVLTLGQDPLAFIPGAYVQFVRYQGQDKLDVVQERRVTGDLLTVLRGLDEIAVSLANERPVRDPLAERVAYDWPPATLHELFVNAVVHRSYLATAPVQISAFDDRVEILSPGGLFGMTPEDFPRATGYRNPALAEAARVLGFANRYGRGIDAADAALRRNGSAPLRFDVRTSFFLAIVERRP
jgi:ATP-dependent DNA helicase RecG